MEEEVAGKVYDSRLMSRLLGYARPYWRRILLAVACLFVYSTAQVCGPLLTKITIDRYLAPTGKASALDRWLAPDPFTGIFQIALIYLAVIVVGFLAEFGQTWLMQITGQYTMFDMRKQLMSHLQNLDIAFYDETPVGRLVTRVTSDVDVLNDLFSSGLVALLGDLLTLAFITATMFRLSPGLTALMLAVMPLVILATALFRRAVSQSYRRIRVALARINSYLQEHIDGRRRPSAFQPRAAQPRGIRGDQPGAHGGL